MDIGIFFLNSVFGVTFPEGTWPAYSLVGLMTVIWITTLFIVRSRSRDMRRILLRTRGVYVGGKPDADLGGFDIKSKSNLWLASDNLQLASTALGQMYAMANVSHLENRTIPFAEAVIRSVSLEYSRMTKSIREYEESLRAKIVENGELHETIRKLNRQIGDEKNRADSLLTDIEEMNHSLMELDSATRRLERELHNEKIQNQRAQRELEQLGRKRHREILNIEKIQRQLSDALTLLEPFITQIEKRAIEELEQAQYAHTPSEADQTRDADVGGTPRETGSQTDRQPDGKTPATRFAMSRFQSSGSDPLASARRILEMNSLNLIRAAGAHKKTGGTAVEPAPDSSTPAWVKTERHDTGSEDESDAPSNPALDEKRDALLKRNALIRKDLVLSVRTLLERFQTIDQENTALKHELETVRDHLDERDQTVSSLNEKYRETDAARTELSEENRLLAGQLEDNANLIKTLNMRIADNNAQLNEQLDELNNLKEQLSETREKLDARTRDTAALKRKLLESERESRNHRIQADADRQSIDALKKQVDELKRTLDESQRERESIIETNQRLVVENKSVAARCDQLERERDTARQDRKNTENLYNRVKADMTETEARHQELLRTVSSLKAELKELKSLRGNLPRKTASAKKKMPDPEKQIHALQEELAALNGKLAELNHQRDQQAVSLKEKTAALDEAQADIARLKSETEDVRAQYDQADIALKNANMRLAQLSEKSAEMDALKERTKHLSDQVEQLTAERDRLTVERDEWKSKLDNASLIESEISQRASQWYEEKQDMERERVSMAASLAEAEAEVSRLKTRVAELESERTELEQELARVSEISASRARTLQEEKERNKRSRLAIAERIGKYEKDRYETLDTIKQLERKTSLLESTIAARDKEIERYRGRQSELTQQLEDEKQRMYSFETESARREHELESLRSELESVQEESQDLRVKISTLQKHNESQLLEYRRETDRLEAELSDAHRQLTQLSTQHGDSAASTLRALFSPDMDLSGKQVADLWDAPASFLASAAAPQNDMPLQLTGVKTISELAGHWLFSRARLLLMLSNIVDPDMPLVELGALDQLLKPDARQRAIHDIGRLSVMDMTDVEEILDARSAVESGWETIHQLAEWRPYRDALAVGLLK